MASVQQAAGIIEAAKKLGYTIDTSVTFDAETPLKKVAQQLNGAETTFGAEDAEFGGFFLTKLLKHPVKKVSAKLQKKAPQHAAVAKKLGQASPKIDVKKSATGAIKIAGKAAAIASFAVPGVGPLVGGPALAAMQAADKLLGDPKVKNAAQLVSNTKALAALGNQPARRGAAVLGAVAQIRADKNAKPGQAVLPPGPVNTRVYAQAVPRTQVKALAAKAIVNKKSFWQKLKELFT